jgi:3-oxoacyl-[acyl-carrier protein] reductase
MAFIGVVLPGMRERGWGRVLAIGSSGIEEPIANLAVSNAARAGLAALLKTLAAEVARDGVTVNLILPGRIDTPRVRSLDEAQAKRTGATPAEIAVSSAASIPAGRYGTPKEFGDTAAFLCSDLASYITGTKVRVDGGLVRH